MVALQTQVDGRNIGVMRLGDSKSILYRIGGTDNFMTKVLKQCLEVGRDEKLVFDHENTEGHFFTSC